MDRYLKNNLIKLVKRPLIIKYIEPWEIKLAQILLEKSML